MAGNGRRNADEALALALTGGKTLREAAAVAGVAERTATSRWADEGFRRRVIDYVRTLWAVRRLQSFDCSVNVTDACQEIALAPSAGERSAPSRWFSFRISRSHNHQWILASAAGLCENPWLPFALCRLEQRVSARCALATLTQADRLLRLKTPLGPDALLITQLTGREALSQLYHFELTLLAPAEKVIDFSKLLGQPVSIELDAEKKTRYFHGIVSRFSQGRRDTTFIHYRMEIVPQFWLLTRVAQSRIFQQVSVPDILKTVLKGLKVKWDLKGTYEPRDYCVQYRESDFNFACRTMEEEGIYYYFANEASGATMVVADTPNGHVDVPIAKKIVYDELRGGTRPENRIYDWIKTQELRSGKVTLWDHCFELPHQHLEASKTVPESVSVGKVTHKLRVGGNDGFELYDYPGAYAQRFDGIDPGGGERPNDLEKIFTDNKRTTEIRLEEEQAPAIQISGMGNVAQLTAGHKFTLDRHPDADGDYVITEVVHSARMSADYRSGAGEVMEYTAQFKCLPAALPFRPRRETPRPVVHGTQTAVVVGPGGEEIYTDKYGRVKVQFHWDREGKGDENSSCWVRVATVWAGKTWGVIHIPRIGQEVIVAFEEGDPDRPIIVGSVYNADHMPPGNLPADKMVSGARTASTPGSAGFNGMVANDTKGNELVSVHSQFNMGTVVENDQTNTIHNNKTTTVDVDHTESVGSKQSITVGADQTTHVKANQSTTVDATRTIKVGSTHTETIGSSMTINVATMLSETVGINYAETVGAAMELTVGGLMTHSVGAVYTLSVGALMSETVGGPKKSSVGGAYAVQVGGKHVLTVASTIKMQSGGKWDSKAGGPFTVKAPKIALVADDELALKCGGATIVLKSGGEITIKGSDITIKGSGEIGAKAGGDIVMKASTIKEN
jgi:type VI secretion system secreted protein VgrG